jgi:hypothetical protein
MSHLRPPSSRRGVLLLLVLSALTLFMMLGALMIVLATRSRSAARAFASATSAAAADGLQSRVLLDEALLALLRGGNGLPAQMTESILGDRYGSSTTGTAVAASVVPLTAHAPTLRAGVLLTASIGNFTPAVTHPCDLNGRVLTFRPDPDDGEVASYRILRTTGASAPYTVYLAATTTGRAAVLPQKACRVIVNGPEFLDEAHDAYDADVWLARIPLVDSRPTTSGTVRPSFSPGGAGFAVGSAQLTCDNDNDGTADGVWLAGTTRFLADSPSPSGGTLQRQVSYLVLDLDGRINLNAHGSLAATGSAADWPSTSQGVTISAVPVGLGYGPADVDVSRLLGGDDDAAVPGYQSQRLTRLLVQGTTALQATATTADQRRPAPTLGTPVEGRYGPLVSGSLPPVPGAAGATQPATARAALAGNSPTDLHARGRVFLTSPSAGAPTLVFAAPDRTADDLAGDPYQLRLDADAPRPAQVRQPAAKAATPPADNPFTVAELERVLRQFDADAATLPPRLAAVLDDYAERSRLTVTTDTWDTPALAGSALSKVRDYMNDFASPTSPRDDAAVYGAMSPDVSAGLRFDVNRPLGHALVPAASEANLKARYCRHLFTLLVALGRPANAATAQWAVNVCDFRDADSTMTIFRYDTNPTDGWSTSTSSPVVIGVERPELVITEAIAWAGHASAVLYHPWNAVAADKNGTTPVETVAAELQGATANTMLLSKTAPGGAAIWRLRFNGGGTANFAGADATTCTLAAGDSICVQTSDPLAATVPKKLSLAAFTPPAPGNATLLLERLADPTKANDETTSSADYNPYVVVDEAAVTVAADQATAQSAERSQVTFWKSTFSNVPRRAPGTYPHAAPWLHWPNRPFVSVGELALVPTGNAREMLADYVQPTAGTPFESLATDPALGLLDAVHVPSRFVGSSQAVGLQQDGTCPLLVTTATTEHVCTTQLPRWRESGRVNVNTIAPNTGNTSHAHLDDGVWKALVGGTATNPFNTGDAGKAADSFTKLLALDTAASKPPLAETAAAPRDQDPFFAYATAIRLANVATIRSHVFAVWITLETTDTATDAKTYHRSFAIIDRSIPVGYSEGENLNVRDTIRLQRFLE